MCLLLFAYRAHPEYPLIVAANRDEFHRRPTAAADWWPDRDLLAGRDLEAGGTWMGVNRRGRFAAVTNYRDPASHRPGARSRGELVLRALATDPPAELLRVLAAEAGEYNDFNLIFGGADGLFVFSSRGQAEELPPGVYGLSNHLLETPWPKVVAGKEALSRSLQDRGAPELEALFEVLSDRQLPMDAELPQTGVGLDWERKLAPIRIVGPDYGTRASTVLWVDGAGGAQYAERSFGPGGDISGERRFQFQTRLL